MSGKANENRFTLLFNTHDPVQKSAVDTLNALGHGKAKYIATAIYYLQHGGAPPGSLSLSPEMVSKIEDTIADTVEALLAQKGIVPPSPSAPLDQQAATRPKPHHHASVLQFDDDSDTKDAMEFLNAMDAFKPHHP